MGLFFTNTRKMDIITHTPVKLSDIFTHAPVKLSNFGFRIDGISDPGTSCMAQVFGFIRQPRPFPFRSGGRTTEQ
jgi:hypothetical protein